MFRPYANGFFSPVSYDFVSHNNHNKTFDDLFMPDSVCAHNAMRITLPRETNRLPRKNDPSARLGQTRICENTVSRALASSTRTRVESLPAPQPDGYSDLHSRIGPRFGRRATFKYNLSPLYLFNCVLV